MYYLKLTVMARSFDFLYSFRKKNGTSFWDSLNSGLDSTVSRDYGVEQINQLHHVYYLPYAKDAETLTEEAQDLLSKLTEDTDDCIIVADVIRDKDCHHLQENNVNSVTEKPWFKDAVASCAQMNAPSAAHDAEPRIQNQHEGSDAKPSSATTAPAPAKEKTDAAVSACETLAQEAKRIETFRANILHDVHGQHHAVEEVVQTIFECDAFTGKKKERSEPLASFLFVGPSGVGKTFLAKKCAEHLGRELLVVDMSTFSDNLANGKFNGDHGEDALVTGFVRRNPNGIILFDEIEKAHINTIHLFLQILDRGVLRDMRIQKDVSFRDTIIMITTNAGASLYEDTSVFDLSNVPTKVVLEALRTDINPATHEQCFPECITTRFANGHVVLFNHLEPYALMDIIKDELALQAGLFYESFRIRVEYDPNDLAAMVLYSAGGNSDARTLRGIAKRMLIKELQDVVMQTYTVYGTNVDLLKTIRFSIDVQNAEESVKEVLDYSEELKAMVFADAFLTDSIESDLPAHTSASFFEDLNSAKRFARGMLDFVLLDPACGLREMERMPYDIEDIRSDGIDLLEYLLTYFPETPIYVLDTRHRGETAFSTLLQRGVRGVVPVDADNMSDFRSSLERVKLNVLINNHSFSMGRSRKILRYNCSQYMIDDETAVVSFDRLSLGLSTSSADKSSMVQQDEQSRITFNDVIGCEEAKKALNELRSFLDTSKKDLADQKKMPKGILLYGPPGTGKTMLAKALAGEVDAAYFQTSATSFFGSLVGQSEQNVRELFRKARKYAPSIVFIDEVDAIGRMRTGSIGSVSNEDTLNAFLAEMDGFATDNRRPVFIIAATNYDVAGTSGRVLDPAFVRRFDRRIFVDLPNTDNRFEFLKNVMEKHGVHFGAEHEQILRNMAQRSSGLSYSDLDIIVNQFLRSLDGEEPTGGKLMDAMDAFRFGSIKKYDEQSLRQTAYHESGHALVNRLLGETPSFLTIVSRGNYGGYMEHADAEDKMSFTFTELMNIVCCSLAGRAAEVEVFGKEAGTNTGARADIEHARYLIKRSLEDYAMGDNLYRRSTSADGEKLMREQYERAKQLLAQYRHVLDALVELLLKEKSLDKTVLDAFFDSYLPKNAG